VDAESALGANFDRCFVALHRYAVNRGLSRADADDLVAATFEVAWRRRDAVPADDPLPWLYGVAANVLRNRRRSDRRYARLLSRLPPARATVTRDLSEVSADDIRAALASLGPRDREVLILVAWDGLAPHEAAVALGCSNVALRSRLARARSRLADALGVRDVPRDVAPGQIPGVDTKPTGRPEAPHG